jgi:hypothetical protein
MKTYEKEVDELAKHLEQIILLTTGGFGSGDAAEIKRMKAVLQLRGLGRKAFDMMKTIAEEVEPGTAVLESEKPTAKRRGNIDSLDME